MSAPIALSALACCLTMPEHPQVLRSKGFVWLGGRDELSGDWSQAGAVLRVRCGGSNSGCGGNGRVVAGLQGQS